MSERVAAILFGLYVTAGVFTFGQAYVSIERTMPKTEDAAGVALGAAMSSFVWPAYWSVQLARKMR